jgi:neuronal cell adhesion molecule
VENLKLKVNILFGFFNRIVVIFLHRFPERTQITHKPEDYYIAAGSPVTFRCNAVTDPGLTLTIEWLNEGTLIDYSAEPRFVQTNDYSLTISKTIELDSGVFTCVAKTELDEDRASATLIVQGKDIDSIIFFAMF